MTAAVSNGAGAAAGVYCHLHLPPVLVLPLVCSCLPISTVSPTSPPSPGKSHCQPYQRLLPGVIFHTLRPSTD